MKVKVTQDEFNKIWVNRDYNKAFVILEGEPVDKVCFCGKVHGQKKEEPKKVIEEIRELAIDKSFIPILVAEKINEIIKAVNSLTHLN